MIDGVRIKTLTTHADDRGYFREILRDDDGLLARFGQSSITLTYPGVIKAFHWHERQDDLWYVAAGMAQVVLYDRRHHSPTKGETQVLFVGDLNPVLILIPHGVVHGYKVLGTSPVVLVYFTTESYNPKAPDEQRLPFDDPMIHFDWTTKHR